MNLLPLLTLAACFASPSTSKNQFDSFVFDENGKIVFSLGDDGELTNIKGQKIENNSPYQTKKPLLHLYFAESVEKYYECDGGYIWPCGLEDNALPLRPADSNQVASFQGDCQLLYPNSNLC